MIGEIRGVAFSGVVGGNHAIGHGVGKGRDWEDAYEEGGGGAFSKTTSEGGFALGEVVPGWLW